jgi:hypothetical protein
MSCPAAQLPGACFCSKECMASWCLRLEIDETSPSAAAVAAALLRDAKRVPPCAGGGSLTDSEVPPAPDSYVENRHSQIRRRESSGNNLAALAAAHNANQHHDSPRSSRNRNSSLNSSTHRAYVCPALPSHPTTPRPAGHGAAAPAGAVAASEHAAAAADGPGASSSSLLLYSPRSLSSLQAMSVEEFDEELDASMPSPPVRIPQAKPILSLKPFALPPPAQ